MHLEILYTITKNKYEYDNNTNTHSFDDDTEKHITGDDDDNEDVRYDNSDCDIVDLKNEDDLRVILLTTVILVRAFKNENNYYFRFRFKKKYDLWGRRNRK